MRGEYELVTLDREGEDALAVANGFDLLVDVIPFEARHAEQLLACDVGAVVAISSASVYADEEGRTLDEAESAVGHFGKGSREVELAQRFVSLGG